MSLRKINIKNFSFRKKDFFNTLDLVSLAMRFCRNCAISNKTCCVSNNSKKYIKFVRSNCNRNLTMLSTSIKQVYNKRLRLKKEICEAHTKLSCLKK